MAIDTGDLARAMKIMGGRAQVKLFVSMPEKAAHALSDALDDLRDLDDSEINEASQMVLEILSDLQRQGVIAPSNF
jgi:flagellar motor switch protein FliG